ncbi:hypothetical protein SDRG_16487 [Saprolegnia diclina VS20]|uniref:Uncharacterized protein n=1 Tax=Saprolegnia diclina (strain VS20) TaxID=1156394 RepID=T0R811_SAPDV|nr:hypothetical protein SDRG_16487 [Saprolegnia diclina VS20]EQC25632.1 hypothetical protein SDRG_16487 [Saprolegnia diclina VS20]|eukprot:XP_008620923.1 hypothetical protein SDRG_16487 [Saprolegnia diclina VS20]
MLLWVQLLVGLYVALAIVASVVSVGQLYRRQRPDAIFQFRSTLAYACQLLLRAFAAARFILVVVAQPLLYEYATWSFGLQGIYFVSATIYQVAHHWSRYEPVLFHRDSYVLNTLLDMSCASVLPALLAFATSTSVLDGQNLALHGASFLVYLLEFVGNHFVVQRQSLGLTLLLPTAYVILLCVHQESTPSTWLDLSSPEAAAGYACLFLSHVVAFGLFYMLSLLKERYLHGQCPIVVNQGPPKARKLSFV